MRSIFNQDEANEDCSAFPDGYDFSKGACEARFWTFLIGGGIFFLGVLIITLLGLKEAIPGILKTRKRASVQARVRALAIAF